MNFLLRAGLLGLVVINLAPWVQADSAVQPQAKPAPQETQYDLFARGAYKEAIAQITLQSSPDDLAFAARCYLAQAMSEDTAQPDAQLLQKAQTAAEQALAISSKHIEGRLQLAIALALSTRSMSLGAAMRTGHGERARDLAMAVLEDDKDNHYALGFLAVWNVEVVRRGGAMGASFMGASLSAGRAYYQAAAKLMPHEPSTHWQYARALAALDPQSHRAEIDLALKQALSVTARTELDRIMQARAGRLAQVLGKGTRREVQTLAQSLL